MFKLNSLFDPDLTNAGTPQPYGFDQMAALYNRYRVHAVTIDVRGTIAPSTQGVLTLAAQPSTETYSTSGKYLGDLAMQTGTHCEFLSAAGNVFHLRKRFTIADLEGVTELQLRANAEDYASLVTTNPTRTPWLRLSLTNAKDSTQIAVNMIVRLEFEVEFFDRVTLPASS